MRYLTIITFCFWGFTAYAQNNSFTMQRDVKNDEAAVLATVRLLANLMIARDTAAMDKILDAQYTLTHMTGYVQPKAEWFDEVQKESMKYYSANEVSHSIVVNADKAEITVQNLVDARIWGSRNTWRLQQKMELKKRNNQWIIVRSVASTF